MKIVILSMGYSGYLVACWRELIRRKGIEVSIFSPQTKYPYTSELLQGIPITVLGENEMRDNLRVRDKVVSEKPDVVVIGGWANPAFKSVAYDSRIQARKVLMIDSMWTGNFRQIAAKLLLHGYVKRLDGVIVAGERGRQFARWLGFRSEQIFTSSYGYDATIFNPVLDCRLALPEWPRSFCFVGRYAPIKGLDVLLTAYREYRGRVVRPWKLHCFGGGAMSAAGEGVVDHGFLQPAELPCALARQGVFILPSYHEPWGVALAEAAGAGMPLICSDAVASGVDLIRDFYNGRVFSAGIVAQLTNALIWMHEKYDCFPEMGRRSQFYAGAYAPEIWADRWLEACSRRI